MHGSLRKRVAVVLCPLVAVVSPGIAVSQETARLVDTGVIFSAQQLRSADASRMIEITPPFWTPTEEDIARLEAKLKPYLETVTIRYRAPKAIAADLGGYKRQYLGYTDGGKKWILVNAFCEAYWREDSLWRQRIVVVNDGGECFFQVRYDPSSLRFDRLEINGDA